MDQLTQNQTRSQREVEAEEEGEEHSHASPKHVATLRLETYREIISYLEETGQPCSITMLATTTTRIGLIQDSVDHDLDLNRDTIVLLCLRLVVLLGNRLDIQIHSTDHVFHHTEHSSVQHHQGHLMIKCLEVQYIVQDFSFRVYQSMHRIRQCPTQMFQWQIQCHRTSIPVFHHLA